MTLAVGEFPIKTVGFQFSFVVASLQIVLCVCVRDLPRQTRLRTLVKEPCAAQFAKFA